MKEAICKKIEEIRRGPWCIRLWKGRAWSASQGRWVKIYPESPEYTHLYTIETGKQRLQRALRRGRDHLYRHKRRSPLPARRARRWKKGERRMVTHRRRCISTGR